MSSRSYSHRSLVKKEAVVGGLGPVIAPLGRVLPRNSGLTGPTLADGRLGCPVETAGNLMWPAGLDEVAQWATARDWPEEGFGGSDLRSFGRFFPLPFPLPLPGSEEDFQAIFSPVGVLNPGIFLMSWMGREEEEVLHGLLAPAAVSVGLAEPPVAGEGRVYDDEGSLAGRVREEALTAVAAALTGAVAGWAAEEGAEASAGFLAEVPPVADFFSSAEAPEGVWRVLDGVVVFFSPAEADFCRGEEEERAGKFSAVFSHGLGAVAVEEEAAAAGQAAADGAAPATTTGAAPGFWTM